MAGTTEDSPDIEKSEMIEGKASVVADKELDEELGKRVEIQRSKEGLSNIELLEESDKAAGKVGNSDSWKITCKVM